MCTMTRCATAAFLLAVTIMLAACGPPRDAVTQPANDVSEDSGLEVATFAGGCFWCMEPPFEKLDGVETVVSGYIGGEGDNPNYHTYGEMGYIEAVRITYDPEQVSYEELLDIFWRQIDPTDPDGQFVDRGPEYRSAIFYHDEEQKRLAEESKQELDETGPFEEPIVTEILPATTFYNAEAYHQDYYKERPLRYKVYRSGSGRDDFLDGAWGQDRPK